MPDGLATHREVLDAAYDAYAMELGKMAMRSEYGVTNVYIPRLLSLYKDKHGLTFNEAQDMAEGVTEGTNYWTKLQDARNKKINSLVNELKESIM
jgi:hypothetical protein